MTKTVYVNLRQYLFLFTNAFYFEEIAKKCGESSLQFTKREVIEVIFKVITEEERTLIFLKNITLKLG